MAAYRRDGLVDIDELSGEVDATGKPISRKDLSDGAATSTGQDRAGLARYIDSVPADALGPPQVPEHWDTATMGPWQGNQLTPEQKLQLYETLTAPRGPHGGMPQHGDTLESILTTERKRYDRAEVRNADLAKHTQVLFDEYEYKYPTLAWDKAGVSAATAEVIRRYADMGLNARDAALGNPHKFLSDVAAEQQRQATDQGYVDHYAQYDEPGITTPGHSGASNRTGGIGGDSGFSRPSAAAADGPGDINEELKAIQRKLFGGR